MTASTKPRRLRQVDHFLIECMLALKPTERLAVLGHFWRLLEICGFDTMAGKPLRRHRRPR